MIKDGKVRVNITISDEMKEWFKAKSEEFGVPMAGLMTMALAQYKQQAEGLGAMKDLGAMMEKIQAMESGEVSKIMMSK